MEDRDLIELAASVIRTHAVGDRIIADVGAVVLSEAGELFTGVSVDTPSWGLCAERSALAAMITAGEYRFRRIAAVWRDPKDGQVRVLPPCGVCREFMRAVHPGNLDAEILLNPDTRIRLRELLPYCEWPGPASLEPT